MQFPQTIFLQGAPTCSVGISPEGLYNRLNDAGRLVFLNQKAIQLASAPFIRVGDKTVMLTTKKPEVMESPDDIPVSKIIIIARWTWSRFQFLSPRLWRK